MNIGVTRILILLGLLVAVCPCPGQAGHPSSDAVEEIVGSWRGHSTCTLKSSPCRDEINVYRISPVAGQLSRVLVVGSKIVDGNTIVMGSGEWKYDPKKHTLESLDGRFHLIRNGNKLEGALTVNDTVFRRIYLQKEK
jgi:hypothetical protein